MKKIIGIILVFVFYTNAFGQKNKEKFLTSLEEKRPCEKLINKEYSELLVGKWKFLSINFEDEEHKKYIIERATTKFGSDIKSMIS